MHKTLHFNRLTGGLMLGTEVSEMPPGTTLRNRGIHPVLDAFFRTRDGSTQLHAVNAVHSLVYFDDTWYSGASTNFYSGTGIIKQSLSGDRLSFAHMPPTAGHVDYLFCAGGDDLFKASSTVYTSGTELITNGDMEADSNWANFGSPSTNERSSSQAYADTYSRKFTPDAANEGIQGDTFTTTALQWYKITAWVYPDDATTVTVRVRNGANDAYTYNTSQTGLTQDTWNEVTITYQESSGKGGSGAYIVFESGTETSGDWYIDQVSIQACYFTTAWGIVPPVGTITLAEGAAGNLSNEYKYAFTFKNSVTGTRSNPIYTENTDIRVLLHCEGADASTTFTDSSSYSHTVTEAGNAQIDDAQAKFGSTSGLFDGSGDYLTIANTYLLSPVNENFCFDVWIRLTDVSTGIQDHGLFGWYTASGTAMRCWIRIISATQHTIYFDYHDGVSYVLDCNALSINEGSPYFTVDTWHHISYIRGWGGDNSTFAVTLDGTAKQTATYSGSVNLGPAAFYIGAFPTGASPICLDGWLDEARVLIGDAGYTENFTPNTAAYTEGTLDVTSKAIALTNIPTSSDPQVDSVEIWRTAGDGTSYFLTDTIDNGTTSYTDDIADSAQTSTELPTDNLKPYSWFDDCFGPYNASMFWISRTQEGERGRVYYSPIGRSEAVAGYIEVASDDKGLQRGVIWNDTPFVFGEAGIYQIGGTNPYFSRQMGGAPGTTKPHTVSTTPIGIMYEAEDGVRIFNGSTSMLASQTDVQLLFRGQAAGSLTAFSGVVSAYGRGTYYISDETQLIGYDTNKRTWRDIGDLSVSALAFAKDADIIGAGTTADGIYNLENEGDTDDNSNNIEIDLETYHMRLGEDEGGLVKHVHIDHASGDASGETLTVYLEHDGNEVNLGTVSQFTQDVDTLHVNRMCRSFGIRITGSVDDWVKIFRISAEVYTRGEEG